MLKRWCAWKAVMPVDFSAIYMYSDHIVVQ